MTEKKFCFIVSEIGEKDGVGRKDADQKYEHIFKPVLTELEYDFKRADEEATPGFISTQIVKRLIDSTLVIADISSGNENVFYELAIRHAVKKPVIIIKKPKQSPPFDVKDIRAIDVDMKDPDVWGPAKKRLLEYIKESETNPEKASESILSDFTFAIDTKKEEDIESEVLRRVKDLQSQVRRVDKKIEESTKPRLTGLGLGLPGVIDNPFPLEHTTLGGLNIQPVIETVECQSCKKTFDVQGPLGTIQLMFMCPSCNKIHGYTSEDIVSKE